MHFDNVVTFFREFGHLLYHMLGVHFGDETISAIDGDMAYCSCLGWLRLLGVVLVKANEVDSPPALAVTV
jgi:hypothetical protein